MYGIVGCTACHQLWILCGSPKTTSCPRCGMRHRTARLRRFYESEDEHAVRRVRAKMLADRVQGNDEEDAMVEEFAFGYNETEFVIDDETYLSSVGIDIDSVREAGHRASGQTKEARSKEETILETIQSLENPTEDEIAEFMRGYDTSAEVTSTILNRLVVHGIVSESGGRYRIV